MDEYYLIKKITKAGFYMTICLERDFEKEGASELDVYAGDINCPHQKEYDPKDGHGHTELHIPESHLDKPFKEQLEWILEQGRAKGIIND